AALAKRTIKRMPYGELLPDALERFMALEAEADAISAYGAILVPSLLQTAEYAEAVVEATPTPGNAFARERLKARLGRQAILAGRRPHLRVVIDEAVLWRPVGGSDVLRRQMLRLIEASERPTTTIQILPFSVGAHPATTGHFIILEFDNPTPPHVFSDGLTGGVLRSQPDDVKSYQYAFEVLTGRAFISEQSIKIISKA